MKYISTLIRLKYGNKTYHILNVEPSRTDRIKKNVSQNWKNVFESDERILPKFDKDTCREY